MTKINVVVSRHQRNTDFVEKLHLVAPVNIMVYDKENPSNPYNVPKNMGREASVYLKYIVDHYECLSDYTFFIHDEERSWHHNGTIQERFKEAIDSGEKFYNINNEYFNSISHIRQKTELMKWYKDYIEEYIPYDRLPNKDWLAGGTYKACAQFLVHKSLITSLPKRFYERLYEYCFIPNPDPKLSGFFLEWTWHLFWVIYPKYYLNLS